MTIRMSREVQEAIRKQLPEAMGAELKTILDDAKKATDQLEKARQSISEMILKNEVLKDQVTGLKSDLSMHSDLNERLVKIEDQERFIYEKKVELREESLECKLQAKECIISHLLMINEKLTMPIRRTYSTVKTEDAVTKNEFGPMTLPVNSNAVTTETEE